MDLRRGNLGSGVRGLVRGRVSNTKDLCSQEEHFI